MTITRPVAGDQEAAGADAGQVRRRPGVKRAGALRDEEPVIMVWKFMKC